MELFCQRRGLLYIGRSKILQTTCPCCRNAMPYDMICSSTVAEVFQQDPKSSTKTCSTGRIIHCSFLCAVSPVNAVNPTKHFTQDTFTRHFSFNHAHPANDGMAQKSLNVPQALSIAP